MGLHFSVANIVPTVSFIRAVPSSPSLVLLFLQCLIHSGQIFKGGVNFVLCKPKSVFGFWWSIWWKSEKQSWQWGVRLVWDVKNLLLIYVYSAFQVELCGSLCLALKLLWLASNSRSSQLSWDYRLCYSALVARIGLELIPPSWPIKC